MISYKQIIFNAADLSAESFWLLTLNLPLQNVFHILSFEWIVGLNFVLNYPSETLNMIGNLYSNIGLI